MESVVAASPPVARDRERDRALIRRWLVLVGLLIVAMVVVGGATRITDSGLSITEWQPIHGVVPPLDDAQWQEEFAKYQTTPQFQIINSDMTLEEFKGIYWWEYAHRALGRLIGLVVLVPLVYFWISGRVERPVMPHLVALFVLGALQGIVGWWMVASGLVERTDVSQYRLAIHLTLAFVILAYVTWLAQGLSNLPDEEASPRMRRVAGAIVILVLAQVFLGGLVAGTNAGLTYNTWPWMDGALVPPGLFIQSPWWINLFENVATVQFDHRMIAYLLFAVVLAHAIQAWPTEFAGPANAIVFLVVVQVAVGVLTLIFGVPKPLALLHQLGAVLLVIVSVMHLRSMRRPIPSDAEVAPR